MATPENAPKISDASAFRKRASEKDQGVVVELPSGFFVKIRRPSITGLIKDGIIPSDVAMAMQAVTPGQQMKPDELVKSLQLLDIIAQNSMLEPKVIMSGIPADDEILVSDLEDTDKQYIMQFVQSGVTDLTPFRTVK